MTLPDQYTVTVNLKPNEAEWLARLALVNGMNEEAVMRQAFRVYQTIAVRQHAGWRMTFVDENGQLSPLDNKLRIDTID